MTSPRRRHRRLAAACSALALGSLLALPVPAWASGPEGAETEPAPDGDPGRDTAPDRRPGGRGADGRGGAGGDGAVPRERDEDPVAPPEHDDDPVAPPEHDDDPGATRDRQRSGAGPTGEQAGAEEVDAATEADAAEEPDDGQRVGGSVADVADVADLADACEPMVTHTPEGSTGHRHAVAITSQALERGVAGWTHVGWEAAEGTTVDEVHVVREDGTERRVGGNLRNGYAEDVLELRFCGDPAPEGDRGPGSDGDGERGQLPPDDGPRKPRPDAGAQDASGEADDAEVEVLGTKLTADDEAGGDTEVLGSTLARTGVEVEVLTGLGAAGMGLGLATLAGARRLRRRAT